MSLSLSLSFNQLKSLISQCEICEKIEIVRFLERETFSTRFSRLLTKIKTDTITLEEITAEVENVRQSRYNEKNHEISH